MTVYTTLPTDDENLEVTVIDDPDLVTLNINPAQVTGSGGALGTVTNVNTGTGLTGGPITTSGTISIDDTVVVTLTGSQELTNKTGLISQWTNDSGYLTAPYNPFDQDLNTTDDVVFNTVTATNEFIGHLDGSVRFSGRNTSGSTIEPGQVVYISGISGNTPTVAPARADSSSTMPGFGIAIEQIANNVTGQFATFGSQQGLDVNDWGETGITFSAGDTLYVSATEAGHLTNVPPAGESNAIQNMGKLERATPTTNTTIKVGGAGRSNDTPNLNDGNIFIGNSSNEAVTASLDTEVSALGYIKSETDAQTLSFSSPDLSISNGNTVDLSALTTTSLPFSSITSTPTTIAGYGITDAFDGAFSSLSGTPTTIAGYGITDAFDGAFSSLTGTPTTIAGYGITDAFSGDYNDLTNTPTIPTQTTINNNADNRVITGSGTADNLNGEADFTWDGTNGVMNGSASGYDGPVLCLKTDNTGYNRAQLLCEDSNGKAFAQVGQINTFNSLYQWNITLGPDNTHGRSGVTTFAGDYFVSFEKDYSNQSAIGMCQNIYGANNGFTLKVRDDFNSGGGNQYGSKPIIIDAQEIVFKNDNGDEYIFPTDDGTNGQVITTDGNGNLTFQDAGGLAASTTPTLNGAADGYQGLDYVVTVTNYDDYVPNSQFRIEVTKDSDSSVSVEPQDVTDNGDGTFTFVVPVVTGAHTVRVKGQDFNKGESAEATMSVDLSELSITARYWRIKDFDDGGNATNTSIMVGNFRMYANAGQGGTSYPSDMTANNAPTPYVASGQGAFNATYDYFKGFDSNLSSFYWNLSGDMASDYLAIDLGSAQTIKSFIFRSGNGQAYTGPFTIYYATQSDFSDEVKLKQLEFTSTNQNITFG